MTYKAPIAVHPGETLKEILDSLQMKQVELAARTGLHVKTINEIIKGITSVTPETALRLSTVLGMSDGFWNNLQKNYNETLARIAHERLLEDEKNFVKRFTCINELVKFDYITKAKNVEEKVQIMLNFLRISSFKYMERNYSVAWRKSNSDNLSKENLVAWLRIGEIEASKINTKHFDKVKLKEKLSEIRTLNLLRASVYSDKLQILLAECGIALVYTPYLKNTYVNGASRWILPEKALIQLTPRNKKEDILWFTLFHELGHLINHPKKEGFISYWENEFQNSQYQEFEVEANEFASKILIPQKEWDLFYSTYNNRDRSILDFAMKIGVKPGIVAGRLAKITGNWARYDKFREKIFLQ